MVSRSHELPPIVYARAAGFLYLMIIVFGIFSEAFVRSSLIVPGDAATTTANILASESLFRVGFVADAMMLLCDVAIAVLFYVLFRPVNKTLSLMAAAFRLTQAAVLGFNLLNYYAAILLLGGVGGAAAFDAAQLDSLVMFFLQLHAHGYDLGLLFFGVSTLILGFLVVESRYFPAILGYGLMAAALVYLTGSFARFLFPDIYTLMMPLYIVPVIAELSFCLLLLVKGVRS